MNHDRSYHPQIYWIEARIVAEDARSGQTVSGGWRAPNPLNRTLQRRVSAPLIFGGFDLVLKVSAEGLYQTDGLVFVELLAIRAKRGLDGILQQSRIDDQGGIDNRQQLLNFEGELPGALAEGFDAALMRQSVPKIAL